MSKKRLDVLLYDRGLVESRKIASDLIKNNKVLVNGKEINKPSKEIGDEDKIEITEIPKYVGRAGLKLEVALNKFKISVLDKVALDVGSSTGGFSDCLLQNGIKKIYAVDVGTGQLKTKIKNDGRVISIEKTDIRNLNKLPEKIDLAVIDVSFISLDKVLPSVLDFLKEKGEIVALIKPQFEVGKENVGKNGIVKDKRLQKGALEKIKIFSKNLNLKITGEMESPIKGGDGNAEYLLYLKS